MCDAHTPRQTHCECRSPHYYPLTPTSPLPTSSYPPRHSNHLLDSTLCESASFTTDTKESPTRSSVLVHRYHPSISSSTMSSPRFTPTAFFATSSVVYLPISQSAAAACASVNFSAINHFNASVGQQPEYPSLQANHQSLLARISRPTTFHLMAVLQTADSSAEHWVDGVGEVLGVVMMDCSNEAAVIGPVAVSTSAQCRGVGRALTQRCIEEAKQRRIKSLRVQQVAANAVSFSLYHSLGFRAFEYMVALQGHVSAAHYKRLSNEMQVAEVSIRAMERADIAVCNQLYVATNSFSRLADITHCFDSQPSQLWEAPRFDGQQNGATAAPIASCLVAVGAGGAIVGYCTGWAKFRHSSANKNTHSLVRTARYNTHRSGLVDLFVCRSVSKNEKVAVDLYAALSHHLQQSQHKDSPVMHVIAQRNGGLIDRLMRVGCRAVRQTCLMVYGEYEPPHRFVYCPSIHW